MNFTSAHHATLVFERKIPATIDEVFAALADAATRSKWGAPTNDVLRYEEADFREGGKDRFYCGPKANPKFQGTTQYLDIVANQRIVSSETIEVDGKRLCTSMTTVELMPVSGGTKLKSTSQIASFIGEDMIKGHESGTNASLDNLVHFLSTSH